MFEQTVRFKNGTFGYRRFNLWRLRYEFISLNGGWMPRNRPDNTEPVQHNTLMALSTLVDTVYDKKLKNGVDYGKAI